MKRAAIYKRVSTTSQEDNTSLEGQHAACQQYAAKNNLTIVAEFHDVASGESLNRPGFRELEALVERRGVDAVIVYHQDRLSRNLIDTLLLIQKFSNLGIELHDTTQGEIRDSLLSTITAVIAAEEKKNINRRMQKGMLDKVKQGKISGRAQHPFYGYRYEGQGSERTLVINEDEARIVRLIYHWYLEDKMSIRGIAARLSEQRVPTPRDNGRKCGSKKGAALRGFAEWHNGTVENILSGTVYKGVIYYHRYIYERVELGNGRKAEWRKTGERPQSEWIIIPVPAIVSEEAWERSRERREAAKGMSIRNTKRQYLLRCRVRCSCGYAMNGYARTFPKGETERVHLYYRCCAKTKWIAKPCNGRLANAPHLDNLAWEWLKHEVTPERILAGIQQEREQATEKREQLLAQRVLLEQQLADFDGQLTRIKAAYVAGVLSLEETAEEKGKVAMAKQAVDADLANVRAKLIDAGPSNEEAAQLLIHAEELHSEMEQVETFEERCRFIEMFDVRAQIELDDEGRRWARFSGRLSLQGHIALDEIVPSSSRSRAPPTPLPCSWSRWGTWTRSTCGPCSSIQRTGSSRWSRST